MALRAYATRPDCHLHDLHKRGEEHPNWKGGVAPHSYRRIAFEAHGRACQRCGSTRHINVHHRDRDRSHCDPANLEVLCRSCHNREHELGGAMKKGAPHG